MSLHRTVHTPHTGPTLPDPPVQPSNHPDQHPPAGAQHAHAVLLDERRDHRTPGDDGLLKPSRVGKGMGPRGRVEEDGLEDGDLVEASSWGQGKIV